MVTANELHNWLQWVNAGYNELFWRVIACELHWVTASCDELCWRITLTTSELVKLVGLLQVTVHVGCSPRPNCGYTVCYI